MNAPPGKVRKRASINLVHLVGTNTALQKPATQDLKKENIQLAENASPNIARIKAAPNKLDGLLPQFK